VSTTIDIDRIARAIDPAELGVSGLAHWSRRWTCWAPAESRVDLRLATGGVGVARLLAGRRLRLRGDLRFAIRLAGLFDIPRS
jgi:hypothetical protein